MNMDNDIFKHPRMRFVPPVLWKVLAVVFLLAVVYKLGSILIH